MRVDTVLGTLVGGLLILGVTALAVIAYQRSLDKPGGREGLGTMPSVLRLREGDAVSVRDPQQPCGVRRLECVFAGAR